jgi:hypothetical protein
MISEAFVCLDYGATPTMQDDGAGGSFPVYPPLAGLYAITDTATFNRSADVLTPYRVTMVPAQRVLGGDVPESPALTVTLHFADQAAYDAVVDPVNALGPIFVSPPAPQLPVQSYRFKAALRQFPSLTGDPAKTLRDDVDAYIPTAPGEVQDRWLAPEFARNDQMLNSLAVTLAGGDALKAQQLLDAIFSAAAAIP